ncbi:MAG: hypothetical protein KKA65_05725 [Nanoarchaeota archaeon]|nr:hypothetical protein [Nanoarchaeota archaeon]MBU4241769.1 hypothetical protein [Nanoarchaeota archaeon]MBU4351744.1 hypothetical protein [Nanoarchaeota archaeon]MBU4456970.1 hypothetical protein [Nanoarchaeota archaeon]MCG2719888.1 hypothetical protein [Nanoarchaeota archaeon]
MAYNINEFAKAYQTADLKEIGKLDLVDELRMHQYRATQERADKELNPAKKFKMMSELWQDIMQSGSYFAGAGKLGSKVGELDLGEEETLSLFVQVGSTLVDKLLKK